MIKTHHELAAALAKGWTGKPWRATSDAIHMDNVEWLDESTRPTQQEVEAAHDRLVAGPTPDEIEAEVVAMLNGGNGQNIDWRKLLKAKFISDLAHRLGKAPGALTAQELGAERNRITAIYKAL